MRRAVLILGTFLLSIGTLRLAAPGIFLHLMALDPIVALLGIVAGAAVILNGTSYARFIDLRFVFRVVGITLLAAVIYGVNSPTFGDMRDTYVPVGDLFVALESGIVMLLLAAEKNEEAVTPLVYLTLAATYLYRRLSARWSPAPVLPTQKHAQ